MAGHARLENEFTEDEKCHNLWTWLISFFRSWSWRTRNVRSYWRFGTRWERSWKISPPVCLRYLCLMLNIKKYLCKQCRSRSDAVENGIWSGSSLFAINTGISAKKSWKRITNHLPSRFRMNWKISLATCLRYNINVLRNRPWQTV